MASKAVGRLNRGRKEGRKDGYKSMNGLKECNEMKSN